MILLVPIGHDRKVHGPPTLTFLLLLACTVIWVASTRYGVRLERDIVQAQAEVQRVLRFYPDARVDWTVRGLPEEVTEQLENTVYDPHRGPPTMGDRELDTALRTLVATLNRVPLLRFGYRTGAPSVGSLFSSMFMHADVWHLAGNMLFLWVAGSALEAFWGRIAFLALYVFSGIVGTFLHQLFHPDSFISLVGASGAISGLLGAFLVGHPNTGIRFAWLFFFARGTFVVPAWICIPLWAGQQLLLGTLDTSLENEMSVAYWAHVGGFAFGLGAAFFMKGMRWVDDYEALEHTKLAAMPPPLARGDYAVPRAPSVRPAAAASAPVQGRWSSSVARASQPAAVGIDLPPLADDPLELVPTAAAAEPSRPHLALPELEPFEGEEHVGPASKRPLH